MTNFDTSLVIANATQFGVDAANPNGAFTITGNSILPCQKTYYFWLVYDINCSALTTDSVDATISSISYNSGTITPGTTNPTGRQGITNPTALAGTYTIPGSYSSIANAISDLNTKGLSNSVIFNISNTHVESAPTNGYLIDIEGCYDTTKPNRTVTFKCPLVEAYQLYMRRHQVMQLQQQQELVTGWMVYLLLTVQIISYLIVWICEIQTY